VNRVCATQKAITPTALQHEADQAGHFAAWEQLELFAAEIRAAFGSLRKVQ
jgi:hypothetical protein